MPSTWLPTPTPHAKLCSYLPQAQMPIDSFRAREAIELTATIRGGDRGLVRRRTDELLDALDIRKWEQTTGQQRSGGVKRLIGFAMVACTPGRVVILDEPTNDVDPLRRRLLWEQIRALGDAGVAVFLVTHNVLEAEKSVDRLAVIDDGRLIAQGTPSSLKASDLGRMRLQVPETSTPEMPGFVRDHARVSIADGLSAQLILDQQIGLFTKEKRDELTAEISRLRKLVQGPSD